MCTERESQGGEEETRALQGEVQEEEEQQRRNTEEADR